VGFFLVGAYQESLANEHNLFGAIHEAEIHITPDGDWEITKLTKGDPIDELLESRNYSMKEILDCYQSQLAKVVEEGRMTKDEAQSHLEKLLEYSKSLPYLVAP
jgi:arginine decarboxylase